MISQIKPRKIKSFLLFNFATTTICVVIRLAEDETRAGGIQFRLSLSLIPRLNIIYCPYPIIKAIIKACCKVGFRFFDNFRNVLEKKLYRSLLFSEATGCKPTTLLKSWKYKNTRRNNYSNIFIVLGMLKSLLCFPLDVDVNDILKYRINYLLRKRCKKAIANKKDCLNTRFLIATFHEITIKYVSHLKTQLVLLDVSTNHNVGSPRSLQLKFCQMIYLLKGTLMQI